MTDKNSIMARRIASAVRQAGGRTYYVGGYVRDRFLGLDSKDIDIEIHGIPVRQLEVILDSLGERLAMGASFGIMGLRHYDLDIAMPRAALVSGHGHTDFEAFVDPFIGEENAARRRDFTMNALMQDVLTGEVLDYFGGREDIVRRRIRHVDDRTFAEDPLRVFRAAQFAARFGFSVAEETTALSASLPVDALPGERIMTELEKTLLKAEKPSVFFRALRKMDQLSVWFPEFKALIGVPSAGEGDAWDRTLEVLDGAAPMKKQASDPLRFMLAALCLGPGKASAAPGPAGSGPSPVLTFLGRITGEVRLKDYVENMVLLVPETDKMAREDFPVLPCMKLFDRSVCPEDLLLLAGAAHPGQSGSSAEREAPAADHADAERRSRDLLALYRERMARPSVMGRDLLRAGLKPGPLFSEALAFARQMQLEGIPKADQLPLILARFPGEGAS